MDRQLSHREIEELLGVYALDAVEDDERELVELHLRECPRCRAEVAEHREVAAFLGNSTAAAPEGLWSRIAASLEDAPPPLELVPARSRRGRATGRFASNRVAWAATALSTAAALVFAVVAVAALDDGPSAPPAVLEDWVEHSARLAAAEPGAQTIALASGDGALQAKTIVLPDGTGFFLAEGLPELPTGRTYQLWAVVGAKTISAGVLGRSPRVVPFTVAADTAGFAVTEEEAGGVVSSSQRPVLIGLRKA